MSADYVELFELASGGMGRVDLVVRRDGEFERLYALKRLKNPGSEEVRQMFMDEARIAGLIRHPNVVSVLDVGSDAEGAFLVMDWVDGVALHRLIHHGATQGPIPMQLCATIGAQVAAGINAAHQLKTHSGESLHLVHRDVSPQNILVGFDGVTRVTDFGIAKIHDSTRTATGVLKGKLAYLAPEQLRFEAADHRTDIFALGIVLFELCAGRRLYGIKGHSSSDVAQRILHEPVPALGELRRDAPLELEVLLQAMLSKDREERPRSALEVSARLKSIAASLAASEGLIDVEEFLEESFGDERRARQSRIAASLDTARSSLSGHSPSERRHPPSLHVWATVGATLLSLAALGLTTWIAMREPAPAPEATLPAGPARSQPIAQTNDASVRAQAPEPLVEPAPRPQTITPAPMRRRVRRRVPMRDQAPSADPVKRGWGAAGE